MSRRRFGGPSSLKRRTRPRKPEPIRPEDYATAENPIGVCRGCGHHTSAFCGGCTAIVLVEGLPGYCGHDCRESLTGAPQARSIPDHREAGDDPTGGTCGHVDDHGQIDQEGGCDRCET